MITLFLLLKQINIKKIQADFILEEKLKCPKKINNKSKFLKLSSSETAESVKPTFLLLFVKANLNKVM